ncbi:MULTISPECIES: hypothetical protein [Calothrix]|uniref:Uncharacterized protein n=2 Tax=Calothrix TaxID=1186 RepID=A0ABR8A952_9CYAN|nr:MULTISPECIES: hypothetical protein [Calothrix]MBD2196364.1 hypothetical protein [Calothrix parietina FACHB-288]MBD2225240.1 hypothetical protein [Calothrix anomala FACHB-343]
MKKYIAGAKIAMSDNQLLCNYAFSFFAIAQSREAESVTAKQLVVRHRLYVTAYSENNVSKSR